MKTATFTKRLCTATVCLALLCGMFCSISFLPAAAVTESTVNAVDIYSVDFTELADMVDVSAFNVDTGLYRSTIYDDEINTWADNRFVMYFNREGKTPIAQQKKYLGQSSFTLANDHGGTSGGEQYGDSWGGEFIWNIHKDLGLYHQGSGGEIARKSDFLTLKTADGALAELTNMEITVDFYNVKQKGMVFVSLHEQTPGYYAFNGIAHTSDIIGAAYNGSGYGTLLVKTGDTSTKKGFNNSDLTTYASGTPELPDGGNVRLYVKSLGTTLTVKVTSIDGSVVYDDRVIEDAVSGQKGYISVGVANSVRAIKRIEVKELDENGNPVDFGTASDDVEIFKADFKNLIGYDLVNKYYPDTANTTDANKNWFTFRDGAAHAETAGAGVVKAYLDNMFSMYYNSENVYGPVFAGQWQACDGQVSDCAAVNQLYDNYWLQRERDSSNSYAEHFRLITSLVPRVDGGEELQLKNFKATFNYYLENSGNNAQAVIVGFRQNNPGMFVSKHPQVNKNQGVVAITYDGVSVAAGEQIDSNGNSGIYNTDLVKFTDINGNAVKISGSNLIAEITVINDECWVTIKNTSGEVLWNNGGVAFDISSYDMEGYFAIGLSSHKVSIANLEVTRLDDEGNPADIDNADTVETFAYSSKYVIPYNATGKYPADVDGVQNNWYTYTDSETLNGTRARETLDVAFDIYYNSEGKYLKTAAGVWTVYEEQTDDYASLNQLYNNKWLQRKVNGEGGHQDFRLITSMVPRSNGTGEAYRLKNFEISYQVYFEHDNIGAVILGFRQQTPGKFVDGYWNISKEQAFVKITRAGMTVAGGDDIFSGYESVPVYEEDGKTLKWYAHQAVDGDMYNVDQTVTFDDPNTTDAELFPRASTIKVKVVNAQCWVDVYDEAGTALVANYGPYAINYDKEGYIALGLAEAQMSVGDIKITRLDEEGNPIDIEAVKEDTPLKEIAYVNAVNGEELKAGSLIATGVSGTKYIPQRVGFREGGDASAYTVDADEEVTWSYAFCQPTLTDPNIGNIGNSHNSNLNGLRFVSRFTREVIDGTEYVVTADGTQYAISDYGMLVSSQPGIEANTGKTANEVLSLNTEMKPVGNYVQKLSIVEEQKFYDVCDDHIDMAVTLINIDKVTGYGAYEDIQFYARPYVVVMVDSAQQVLYGNVFNASYGDVASVQ